MARLAGAALLGMALTMVRVFAQESHIPDETAVYWNGEGKRVHVEDCRRLTQDARERAKMQKMTAGEARAKGLPPCSRCPGSALNKQRAGEETKTQGDKPKPTEKTKESPGVAYDPDSIVYVDALWYRVHAADSPDLILKEHKKTLTLAEADKLGYRIGEAGQSGRSISSFVGYKRQHPLKEIPDDALLAGTGNPKQGVCYPGCHRRQMNSNYTRKTKAEWIQDGFVVCGHCIERGPSEATISEKNWQKIPKVETYTPPQGWTHQPYSPDKRPSAQEIEVLIQETLAAGSAIQELPFDNPVASVEQFVMMRFFFPVHQWLNLYKLYRSTGDERVYALLLESARHYNELSKAYPSAAQYKARDPEGLPYMYSMAMCARITLQKARKDSKSVTAEELTEVEDFLKTMVAVLKPTYEGDENLDPEMGIPKAIADDFRKRAFNRAMNGIGTLATIAVALEDLQAIRNTKEHQVSIDRYRKTVGESISNWFKESHVSTFDGKKHFYYPYVAGKIKEVEGDVIFKRPEDAGHYSHTLQGVLLIYETMPEVGIDDDFMISVANALHHNAITKIKREGKMVLSGHIESPIMSRVRPYGKNKGDHQYSPARDRFYMLQAFRDDMIDGLCEPLNEEKKKELNSESDRRLATLHAQYLKAFRADRSLIHLPHQ